MWELILLNNKQFSFKQVAVFDTFEEALAARSDMNNEFILYCGPLPSTKPEIRAIAAKINNFHHNHIVLLTLGNAQTSGMYYCENTDGEGDTYRIKCFYWNSNNIGYGWKLDGGPCPE
ncbi:hypothetical protein ACFQ3S_17900 [Mucilaginibacter terrae]|uniref:hypothetical protein n=1 Tax=Mucilaginibacter terrae TaxID=1955052 RepID=UPI00363B3AAA